MWYYLKKAGNIIGAGFGLYMLWSCGVEYGVKLAKQKNANPESEIPKTRVRKEGNVITIDLSDDE